jgi:uncharacterized repeat protein (TIGR02543 family)
LSDGGFVHSESVQSGGNATPPSAPTKSGYTFDGWDGDYTNVTEPRTITAKWLVNEINVSLPSFPSGTDNVQYTDHNGGTPFSYYVGVSPNPGDIGGMVSFFAVELAKTSTQANTVKDGYAAVVNVYPQFTALSSAVNAYTPTNTTGNASTYAAQMDSAANAIIDAIFTMGGTRSNFDNEFAAYELGNYYRQRSISDLTASEAFENALSGMNITINKSSYGYVSNADAILTELRSRLLNKINAATTAGVTNTSNKQAIENLNGCLLTQIGEDRMQVAAKGTDLETINVPTDLDGIWQYLYSQ